MRIVIIGSGNVATILGRKIYVAGHDIIQVYSRNGSAAAKLAREINASPCIEPVAVNRMADLYLVSVSDTAIPGIPDWLKVNNKLVVHTAGSVSIEALSTCSSRYGVIYPLQTLRKESIILPEIPILVDGNDDETKTALFHFAQSLSGSVQFADDKKRSQFHVAAVIMNNFSNHLYTLAGDYCTNENLDFRLLTPLISETAERLKYLKPGQVQTGPAIRKDLTTIAAHLEKLKNYPDLSELYTVFTKKILAYYDGSVSADADPERVSQL
ncbi:MAG: DUF2520 domain-containing protein [Chitinophagaceae bacterium]|nr:MAG: DUF2520 domain-containing protein [Chitinophagaceae bacterium]